MFVSHRLCSQSIPVLAALVVPFAVQPPAHAQGQYGYSLAAQQEISNKRGFAIAVENFDSERPRNLAASKLVLSVTDGQSWRYPSVTIPWEWEREYQVRAVLGSNASRLWLDGKLVAESPGGFKPSDLKIVKSGLYSNKLGGSTDFLVQQTALKITAPDTPVAQVTFNRPEAWLKPLFMLEPQTPVKLPWSISEGKEVTVEVAFRFVQPDVSTHAPYVDRFGQSRHADWPGKIRSDEDFQKAVAEEKRRNAAWGTPQNYDEFGGYRNADWKETPTGFFRTVKRNDFWWLVSPEGNPCFYLGVDDVTGTWEATQINGREAYFEGLPPQQGEFADAWKRENGTLKYAYPISALIRKHGKDWDAAAWRSSKERLRTWGFSGAAKWSGVKTPGNLVTNPVIRRTGVPTLGRLPDVFNPETRATFRNVVEKAIGPEKNNPYVLGWTLGNEHDEIVLRSDIQNMLKQAATVPAKSALVQHALEQFYSGNPAALATAWKVDLKTQDKAEASKQLMDTTNAQPPARDIEALRQFYAHTYYDFVYKTFKEIDPNHLYMGFWINMGWWESEDDWKLMGAHCDVIGFDDYRANFDDDRYQRLSRATDKPVLCGEMGFPSWYNGQRGYGIFGASPPSDKAAGELYTRWIEGAARDPYTIGNHWFQYRDQPITGRGPQTGTWLTQGEHYAFGIVDIADQPKWELVEAMRAANLRAAEMRLKVTRDAAK